jgi:uncharacterized protein
MNDTPYIHTFRTSERCYVYDVNTHKILQIPEAVYDCLSNQSCSGADEATIAFIQDMKAGGFLRTDRVEVSEHPATPLLPFYLKSKLHHLILQVTQNCNLRCNYCVYSGSYLNRTHAHKIMPVETAERAIDFFFKRTKDRKRVFVSFYGGEPLLNLSLIKHCVCYIEANYYGKQIDFAMTTNGTLLDEEAITFLAEKGLNLVISLDGPEEVHDTNRKFTDNGEGTFAVIMENVEQIKKLRPDYYQEKVRFNAVSDTSQAFCCLNDFISGEDFLGDERKFTLNYVSSNYASKKTTVTDDFFAEREYEYFKLMLSRLGEFPKKKTSRLLDSQFRSIYTHCFQNIELDQERIPRKSHHSGPCIPGMTRLFIDVSGRFFPCERVSELSETVCLGNIDEGFFFEKAQQIMNIETSTHEKCCNCWAYRLCTVCVASVDDLNDISSAETENVCPSVCGVIDELFKDYCVLREMGHTFDEERMLWDS